MDFLKIILIYNIKINYSVFYIAELNDVDKIALNCLTSGRGDVAFISLNPLKQYFSGNFRIGYLIYSNSKNTRSSGIGNSKDTQGYYWQRALARASLSNRMGGRREKIQLASLEWKRSYLWSAHIFGVRV